MEPPTLKGGKGLRSGSLVGRVFSDGVSLRAFQYIVATIGVNRFRGSMFKGLDLRIGVCCEAAHRLYWRCFSASQTSIFQNTRQEQKWNILRIYISRGKDIGILNYARETQEGIVSTGYV